MPNLTNKRIVDYFYVTIDLKDVNKRLCGAKRKQNVKNDATN